MGGQSTEHEVSLKSGAGVVAALVGAEHIVTPIVIGLDGRWQVGDGEAVGAAEGIATLVGLGVDCVFIALHGTYGEDGRIQGMLDILNIPYTGSGCAASALAMDKVRCKAVVQAQGIRVAGHVALDRATWDADRAQVLEVITQDIGLPCVVKACRGGSSVGVRIVAMPDDLDEALNAVFEVDSYLMVEQFVKGTEVTCGVLDAEASRMIRPLPVTEIVPKDAVFFDYAAKYTPGATEEITPARISPEMTQRVQEAAVYVHDMVGCKGWSRSDFILDEQGPVWIEVNTVPGLTETSLYPQACKAVGISYSAMCVLFVEAAIRNAQLEVSAEGTN